MHMLAILCAAYSISLFYRGMLSVIAPEVMTDLLLSEQDLGVLSSLFYISFALAQIPSGIALDRFGPRRTIGPFLLIAVAGTALFYLADDYTSASVGQILIGIGCAPVFTGSMLVIGAHYPPERFAYMTALVIAIGSVGDLLGTLPLAAMAAWSGWRPALLLMMVIAFLVASLSLQGLPQDEQKADHEKQSLAFLLYGMTRVATARGLWPIIPMFLTSYAVLMAIRGLWSGPYLADLFQSNPHQRGLIILAMSIAMAIGTFMLGALDRRLQRTKQLVILGSVLTLIPLLLLSIFTDQSPWFAMVAFVAIGLFGFNYPLLMAHCRTFLSPAYHGRGMAYLTALSFIGVALIQSISGWLMAAATAWELNPVDQYRLLFMLLAASLTAATLVYAFSRSQGMADEPSKRQAGHPATATTSS